MRVKTATILDRLSLGAVAAVLSANEKRIPRFLFEYFERHSWQVVALIVAAAVIGAVSPLQSLAKRGHLDRRVRLQRDVLGKLGELVERTRLAQPALSPADPGLHVWKPKRRLWHPFSPRLERVGFYRLGNTPTTVSFSPEKGKGVVGLCWRDNSPKGVNVEALAARLTTPTDFQREINSRGGDAVMNLSWEEFQRVKHRGAVFAAPVRSGGEKFLGCVSIDVKQGYEILIEQGIPKLAADAAALFGPDDFYIL
jgi:hypothetical protein